MSDENITTQPDDTDPAERPGAVELRTIIVPPRNLGLSPIELERRWALEDRDHAIGIRQYATKVAMDIHRFNETVAHDVANDPAMLVHTAALLERYWRTGDEPAAPVSEEAKEIAERYLRESGYRTQRETDRYNPRAG